MRERTRWPGLAPFFQTFNDLDARDDPESQLSNNPAQIQGLSHRSHLRAVSQPRLVASIASQIDRSIDARLSATLSVCLYERTAGAGPSGTYVRVVG